MTRTKNSIRLLLLAGITLVLIAVNSTLSARTDYEWPRFSMIYQAKGSGGAIVTSRLTWFSKNHWIAEILSDQASSSLASPAPLNYSGARYEFNNDVYIVYDPNTKTESRTQMEPGIIMSPAEWIVPGYEEFHSRGNIYKLKYSANGKRTYRSQELRRCKKSETEPPMPNCNESQIFATEITFEEHGIPIKRTEFIDALQISDWQVIDFRLDQ